LDLALHSHLPLFPGEADFSPGSTRCEVATALLKSVVTDVRLLLVGVNAGAKAKRPIIAFAFAVDFFCVFSPKIACQAPKPPNLLKQNKIELAR
jgi:hypothetical protein